VRSKAAAPKGAPPAPTLQRTTRKKAASREPAGSKQVGLAVAVPTRKLPSLTKATLSGEILLLDRARSLINSGQPAQALPLLNTYHRRFPAGVLARESEVLRQRALP
jgi:hypothetical protein